MLHLDALQHSFCAFAQPRFGTTRKPTGDLVGGREYVTMQAR